MSTYYDIACKECKEKQWIACRSAGMEKPRLFKDESLDKFEKFLLKHEDHDITFVSEQNFQEEYHEPLEDDCFCPDCPTPYED